MAKNPNDRSRAFVNPPGRKARSEEKPENTNSKYPVWSIKKFDHDGSWGRERCEQDQALWESIFPKLKDYESMTWSDIERDRDKNHSVLVTRLIKQARDRLEELRLDDIEELFRFRLSGKERIWGIRDAEVFRILWWDPEHEICPSQLKNT